MSHLRIHYPDGTPNCKWSICVNCDAFFRISFSTIIFHAKIFRKFYYCIEVTFITFERLIFKFQRGFVVQRAKLVSWKLWCESTIKLANSITVSFGFVGLMQHFSFFFLFCLIWQIGYHFFWVIDDTKIFHYFGWYALREKVSVFGVFLVSLCIQCKCWKVWTRKAPNMGTFHAVFN